MVNIKQVVKEFGDSTVGRDWYFIIGKSEADGIKEWLDRYVYTIEGEWLDYDLQEPLNETEVYILRLSLRW